MALFAGIDVESLLPYALFGMVATIAWLVMDYLAGRQQSRAADRLDDFRDPFKRRREEANGGGKKGGIEAMTRVLEKASVAAKPLQPKNEHEIGKLRAKLMHAGFRNEQTPSVFLGMKFMGLVAGFFLTGGMLMLTQGPTKNALLTTGAVAGLLFYLPDAVIWFMGKQRKDAIFMGLPDALDLLVVCVEAGLGLDQALRKVADEIKGTSPIIAEELSVTNFQIQMGTVRSEALQDLADRTGVDDVRALVGILIQAEKFGSSVAQALRVQSDAMRTRRRQIAEEKAAKTAVKLIFPLVLFIFPGIFVVLVGPAAIIIVKDMFPKMNGG